MLGSIVASRMLLAFWLIVGLLTSGGGAAATSQSHNADGEETAGAQAFLALAAAERAFVKTTTELGLRDGFLTFFAAGALEVEPGGEAREPRLRSAREQLMKMPSASRPLPRRIDWEPRHGGISRAGDLGYLTGPFAVVDVKSGSAVQQGLYTSVWKKQQDSTWKVLVDLGVTTPAAVDIGRPGEVGRDPGAGPQGPLTSLETAEAEFARVAAKNPARAHQQALSGSARVCREGYGPLSGPAAAALVEKTFSSLSTRSLHVETSSSGDLGFTLGGYAATLRDGKHEYGATLRIWTRTGDGWRIVHEVIKPAPPRRTD